MAGPRETYIESNKKVYVEQRQNFYKKNEKRGMIEEVYAAVRNKEPVPIEVVKKVLLVGNERTREVLSNYEDQFGRLHEPTWGGGYSRGIKECVDARVVSVTILDYMRRTWVHERTAGIGLRSGHVFFQLNQDGIGYVLAHTNCGGESVTHTAHMGGFDSDDHHLKDAHIERVVESIPAGIGRIKDPVLRSQSNARTQAFIAEQLLQVHNVGNPIFPAMIRWDGQEVDVEWLSTIRAVEHPSLADIRFSVKLQWEVSKTLGITPQEQYAFTAVYYDPYRLGRINSPHAIFDLPPNTAFCVTENFTSVESGGSLSGSAVGSLRYAISHGGEGHVEGIGKANGTRITIVLDTDVRVLQQVKEILCGSSAEVKELTNNGETIVLALYDPHTRKVEFLGQ